MKLLAIALSFTALGLSQTTDPRLPDAPLFNYSGDATVTQYLATGDLRTIVSISQNAQCLQQGYQGNPASYKGFWVGGTLAYHLNPPELPASCGPIQVEMDGILSTYNPQTGLADHIEQVMAVYAIGSLPAPPAPFPGFPAIKDQLMACSLLGDPPYLILGEPRSFIARDGLCWFYDTGGNITNCTVCTF